MTIVLCKLRARVRDAGFSQWDGYYLAAFAGAVATFAVLA